VAISGGVKDKGNGERTGDEDAGEKEDEALDEVGE